MVGNVSEVAGKVSKHDEKENHPLKQECQLVEIHSAEKHSRGTQWKGMSADKCKSHRRAGELEWKDEEEA